MFKVGDKVIQIEESEFAEHNYTGVQTIAEVKQFEGNEYPVVRFADCTLWSMYNRFELVQSRGQSKWQSFMEALSNIAIGYVVAILAQLAIFPMFGIFIDKTDHLLIGVLFTVVSLVRSYTLRRLFNRFNKG